MQRSGDHHDHRGEAAKHRAVRSRACQVEVEANRNDHPLRDHDCRAETDPRSRWDVAGTARTNGPTVRDRKATPGTRRARNANTSQAAPGWGSKKNGASTEHTAGG